MSNFPEGYTIGGAGVLGKMDTKLYDGDPRGVVWMWEPPSRACTYVLGCDVAFGRTGWNRYDRTREDAKTDNGAIEIIRIGKGNYGTGHPMEGKPRPDVQVCEYAAPVDPTELGDIANILGRMYAGTEDDQCKCIIEVYPGPGAMTLQRMLDLGYLNHFKWEYYADGPASPTKSMGWHASQKTNRDLWIKASRHINLRQAVVNSPWLAEEYADCRMNPDKQWAENPNGHDDRVRAFNLAIWQANGFSVNIERTVETVRNTAQNVNLAYTDATFEEIQAEWGAALERMGL